ncbi:MAG: hypothetical protein L0212_04090 [Acidobacteria bacterium]|nr:hypothetical protein [Acidobacteriota bacterium]
MPKATRRTVEEEIPVDAEENGQPEEPQAALPRVLPDGFPNPAAMDPWEYMESLTPEQWTNGDVQVYIYRSYPRTMRTSGKSAYLDVLNRPLPLEEIKERWGGGIFELYIKRRRQAVYNKYNFQIEAKPKLESWETLEKEAAEAEAAAATAAAVSGTSEELLRKLVADVIAQRDRAQEQGKKFDPESALENAMAIHGKATDAAIEMIVSQAQRLAAPSAGGEGNIITTLRVLKELGVIGQAATRQENPIVGLRELLALLKELREESADSGGGRTDWRSELVRVAPAALDKVREIVGDMRAMTDRRAEMMLTTRGYRVAAPPAAQPGPASATATAAPAAASPDSQRRAMQDFIKSKIVQMLYDAKTGDDAAVVAENLDPQFAVELANVLKQNPRSLESDSILAGALKHPSAMQFASEYVDYFSSEGDNEEKTE